MRPRAHRGFPEVAIATREEGRRLLARTAYLDRWHPGLPLTGAVTVALASLLPGGVLGCGGESAVVTQYGAAAKACLTLRGERVERCVVEGVERRLLDEIDVPAVLSSPLGRGRHAPAAPPRRAR